MSKFNAAIGFLADRLPLIKENAPTVKMHSQFEHYRELISSIEAAIRVLEAAAKVDKQRALESVETWKNECGWPDDDKYPTVYPRDWCTSCDEDEQGCCSDDMANIRALLEALPEEKG